MLKNEVISLEVIRLKVSFDELIFVDIFLWLIFLLFEEMFQLPSTRNILIP
jgi:hypothetical protein